MPLIKDIQDKNFVSLKDYVEERIASIIAGKIAFKKDEFLNKVRGISEKAEKGVNPFAKKDDDKKEDKEKPSEKDEDEEDDKDSK